MSIRTLLALSGIALSATVASAQLTKGDLLDAGIDRSVIAEMQKAGVILEDDSAPSPAPGLVPVDFWLHVLHNNDGESKVLPLTGAQAGFGGAARFVSLVDQLKAQADAPRGDGVDQGWVMISSGDNILPGINLNAAINNGVPYYDSVLFDRIGYSAITLGNHDFDSNPDVLANVIAGTTSSVFISANLDFTNEPVLLAQQNAGKLARSRVVTVDGRQVGVVGATTELLPSISSPRNTIINPVAAAVQAEINALTANGVQIIILSTHLQGLASELALIPQLTGVDAVIAGGGSEILAKPGTLMVPGDVIGFDYPVTATDLNGNTIPVVTTVGDYKYVGRLVLAFDTLGNLLGVDPASNVVRVSGVAPDAVAADPFTQTAIVNPVQAANDALATNIIAASNVALESRRNVNGTNPPFNNVGIRVSETNVGNLVADSFLWEADRIARANNLPIPQIGWANGGGIRINALTPAGNVSERYTYDQLPFTNVLTLVPSVTPAKLKELLENAVSNVAGADGRFPHLSGVRIVWDASRTAQVQTALGGGFFSVTTPGDRIRDVVLNDGTVIVRNGLIVPGAPSVNIATIDFLVTGGDSYPYNGAPFVRLGVTYQRAFFNFIREALNGQISSTQYPNAINRRIIRRN